MKWENEQTKATQTFAFNALETSTTSNAAWTDSKMGIGYCGIVSYPISSRTAAHNKGSICSQKELSCIRVRECTHTNHDEGKKDMQFPPTTITTNSSHSIRVEERDNWFVTELNVTTICLECPLKCDSDEHTARYQREWRKDSPQRFLLLHNEVLEITEWEMYGFQVVLENELDRLFQWFYKQWLRLKWEWSLCGWLHWYDGLSNDDE